MTELVTVILLGILILAVGVFVWRHRTKLFNQSHFIASSQFEAFQNSDVQSTIEKIHTSETGKILQQSPENK